MNWKILVLGVGVPFAIACGSAVGEVPSDGANGAAPAVPGATTAPGATASPAVAAAGSGAVTGVVTSTSTATSPAGVTDNPPVNPEMRLDGAPSGIVMLKAGDKLHFNCHIEFTDARKATDKNAPTPAEVGTLRFANEAYNGEMCINFGNVTGGSLGLPGEVGGTVPDFAKVTRGVE